MIEITAEIRAFIDKAAAGVELAEDEYIDPADGLIHCKKCGGQRQTVVHFLNSSIRRCRFHIRSRSLHPLQMQWCRMHRP